VQSQPTTTAKLSSVALVLAKPPTPKVPGPAILSDHQMVGRLLEAFGATDLGEGDPVAGANVLAAMAISLANVQRPGTGLVDKDGAKLSVGASLLVSDSLSVGLVGERVLSGLATCQNNFVAHLRDWQRSAARQIAKGPNTRTFDPAAVLEKGSSSALHYMHTNAGMSGLLDSGLCEALVIAPKGLGKRELHERPLVYITAAKPAELSKTLELSHLGRPFIHVGLHDAAACARFRECCTAVMDGTQTVGPMSETVRGCVVATTAPDTLAEVVRANGASATWLASMLWLTDSAAGPEPGDIPADKATVRLNSVQARYRKAMVEAWGERFNYVNTAHSDEAADWQRPQTEWISFLKGQEPELPGITGTARSLLASLTFGLTKIVRVANFDAGFKWRPDDIAAFARWLVQRMANARAAILHTERNARIRNVARALALKLTDGPQTPLKLVHRSHRLPIGDCRLALCLLQSLGVAERSGEHLWQLSPSAALDKFQTFAAIDV